MTDTTEQIAEAKAPLLTSNADVISMSEQTAQKHLAAHLEVVGLPPDAWPLDREDAAKVLLGAGYAVNEGELVRLGKMKQVPDVEMLDARDLMAACICLEARRQWNFTPCLHDPKKDSTRIALEKIVRNNNLDLLRESFSHLDLRYALILMTECESRAMREKLLSTVLALIAIELEALI